MRWILCAWLAATFSGLARGQYEDSFVSGFELSPSGYHVCLGNETVPITKLVPYLVPHTELRPCGGWLPWKTCNVTMFSTEFRSVTVDTKKEVRKCCEGYEQLGRYCALALNRSSEFTSKPGVCPVNPTPGPGSGSVPGSVPGSGPGLGPGPGLDCVWDVDCPGWQKCCQHKNHTRCVHPDTHVNMSSWLNVTVRVKAEHSLVTTPKGIFNHTHLLHSVVTGALCLPSVSVYQTSISWSSGYFSTSSSLLLGSSQLLSVLDVSNRLQRLVETIEEVTAVDIRDVDECTFPVLSECSPLASCTNTLGSYTCTCSPGSTDVYPGRPGTQCMIIPSVTNLRAHNVTGTSFHLMWHAPPETNHTFNIKLNGNNEQRFWTTLSSHQAIGELQPGVLYLVQVTLCLSGHCGNITELKVKTDATTLQATARITNMNFTDDLRDPNSQAYQDFVQTFINQTVSHLPPDILELFLQKKVNVMVTGLSKGSIVVEFILTFVTDVPSESLNIANALMGSLQNSTLYTIDSANITDVDECVLNEDDCSPWAECINIFGSYNCSCLLGYTDANPARPGRTCQVIIHTVAMNSTESSTSTPSTTPTSTPSITPTSTPSTTPTSTPSTTPTSTPSTTPTSTPSSTPTSISSSTPTSTSSSTPSSSTPTSSTHSPFSIISQTEDITVDCKFDLIAVSVARSFLQNKNIPESSLYLGQPICSQSGENSTHVHFWVQWGQCGAKLNFSNSEIMVFQVTLYNNITAPGSRALVRLEVPVFCTYPTNVFISMGSNPSGYSIMDGPVTGYGMFYVNVRLLDQQSNPLPENYTLSPDEEVIVEVGLNTSNSYTKVVINKCWANPTNNPNDEPAHVFVEQSCPVRNAYTTMLQNGNSSSSLVSVNLFQLVDMLQIIYLHCQIQICIETQAASCQPSCAVTPPVTSSPRVANVIGMTKTSCGPLLKSHSKDPAEASVTNTGYILLVLGLCVLVLVSAAALVLWYRRRMGTYSFKFKPRQEDFTYKVFST
ncbi:uromodulin-like 1 [Trichomycterus rosablanca]|uniref:uromodulin-like 1 n=1 Tax=Trichomycterus rosablanca TaxID=2290929 RepID=UPI002F35EDA1